MSTADKLNALVNTKADIKQALIDKGQNPSDVFSTYADNIRAIETGGVFDFSSIGYTGEEEPLKSGLAYAQELMENFKGSHSLEFRDNLDLIIFPVVDTSNCTSFNEFFSGCKNLILVPKLGKLLGLDYL